MKLTIGIILFCIVVTACSDVYIWSRPDLECFDVTIYTTTESGTYPVIIFMTGFGGLVPAYLYSDLLKKIADQKVIVIALSKIQNITAEYVEQKFAQFMKFITDPTKGAKYLFKNNLLTKNVVPDLENQLAFLAQSAGCHVLTLYLTKYCGTQYAQVKLLILMNPVDGSSPYDTNEAGYITHPPQNLAFNTSVLIISCGLEGIPANSKMPACAPDNMSNDRFYQCLPGPKWLLNFTKYGHADMLDDGARSAATLVCKTCSPLPLLTTCNFEDFRQDEANAIVNFTKGILNGVNGQQYLMFLQNPGSHFRSDATIKSNVQQVTPSNGFCQSYP